MDYLWRRYCPQNRYALDLARKDTAPPIEISRRDGAVVTVNPLPRFAKIFRALMTRQDLWQSDSGQLRALANGLLHFLAQLDRISGMSPPLVAEEALDQALSTGQFGLPAKQAYARLSPEQKQAVVRILYRHDQAKGRRLYFREAVRALFPSARISFYRPDKMFLICLPQKENAEDKECVALLVNLFLDATARWQIYWTYSFGIIGRPQTMRMNHMSLYGTREDS